MRCSVLNFYFKIVFALILMTNIIDLYSQNKYTLEISDLTTTSHTRLRTCTNKSHVRFHYTNGKDYKEVFNLDGGDQKLPYNNYNISLDYDLEHRVVDVTTHQMQKVQLPQRQFIAHIKKFVIMFKQGMGMQKGLYPSLIL